MLAWKQVEWTHVVNQCLSLAILFLVTLPGILLALFLFFVTGFSFDELAAIHVRELDYAQRNPASQRGYLLVEECVEYRDERPPMVMPKGEAPQSLGDYSSTAHPDPTPFTPCLRREQQEIRLDVLASQLGQQLRQFYWKLVLAGVLFVLVPFLLCWLVWKSVAKGIAVWVGLWQKRSGYE